MYALALVIASILVLLGLSSSFFSVDRMNTGFMDYRKAVYQSYLQHDVEYSLRKTFEAIKQQCVALAALGNPDKCQGEADIMYANFVAAWSLHGFVMAGGGVSAIVTPAGADVRLVSDLHWKKGEYEGTIPKGYGG